MTELGKDPRPRLGGLMERRMPNSDKVYKTP